jgi:hypothetical protein
MRRKEVTGAPNWEGSRLTNSADLIFLISPFFISSLNDEVTADPVNGYQEMALSLKKC